MHGLAFGFSASVLAFNRGPTLVVSLPRRVFAALTATYVDDLSVLDCEDATPSANNCLKLALDKFGYSQSKLKAFPPSCHRTLLGASVPLGDITAAGVARVQPATTTHLSIMDGLDTALDTHNLSNAGAPSCVNKWAGVQVSPPAEWAASVFTSSTSDSTPNCQA